MQIAIYISGSIIRLVKFKKKIRRKLDLTDFKISIYTDLRDAVRVAYVIIYDSLVILMILGNYVPKFIVLLESKRHKTCRTCKPSLYLFIRHI